MHSYHTKKFGGVGRGVKGLNLLSILEEACVFDKYLGIFVNNMDFSLEKMHKKFESQANK